MNAANRITEDVLSTIQRDCEKIRANPLRVYDVVNDLIALHVDIERSSVLVLGSHLPSAQRRRQE